jgi:hypothetical protein
MNLSLPLNEAKHTQVEYMLTTETALATAATTIKITIIIIIVTILVTVDRVWIA